MPFALLALCVANPLVTSGFCSQRIGSTELWYFLSCYCWPSVQRCHWSPVVSPWSGTVVRICDILMPAWTICWTQVVLPVFWKPMVLIWCLYYGIFNTGSNFVIGIKYRMPNSSVDIFNEHMSDIYKSINFVTCWEICILTKILTTVYIRPESRIIVRLSVLYN